MTNTISHEEIYTTYRDKVFSYIRSKINKYQDAEDLCEEVFIKVFQKIDTYDESKSALGTWIYNIAKNKVIDFYRSNNHQNLELLDNYDYIAEEDDSLCEDDIETLTKALNKLPQQLRDIIILKYYEDLPLTEISKRMGISYGMIKLKHKEALLLLKLDVKDKI